MAGHRFPNGMPVPSRAHVFLAKLLGGSMTFWILYRGRQDMPVVLVSSNFRLYIVKEYFTASSHPKVNIPLIITALETSLGWTS
ncbi:11165_t:CDS:2 [Paraglomus brasilianum]|uniref:11165_t:CDS:1 n=1 Tax=Paraglomus brasilianum TaxID=144538 RepID=A0A9N8VRL6_9GLOM|nr:11165_t:CDS:2 [Paraglomus brasilianum]